MDKKVTIGSIIWQEAVNQGFRKIEFAKKMDVSRQTLDNWINGEHQMNYEDVQKASKLLNVEFSTKKKLDSSFTQNELLSVSEKSNARLAELGDQVGVPLVESRAYAGYLRGFSDPVYMEALPKIYVRKEFGHGGNFVAFVISGDSLNDGNPDTAIYDGDIFVGRELARHHWTSKISNQYPFVIVHPDGIICKQIIAHDVNTGKIICHSRNPAPLPEYEDFELNLNDVQQLFYLRDIVRNKKIKY